MSLALPSAQGVLGMRMILVMLTKLLQPSPGL